MPPVGGSRAGSSILPSGTYGSELAAVIRQFNAAAAAATGVFSALRVGIAAAQAQVESFVAKADPAAVIKFKLAVDDLYGVIGRALLPVLNNFTTTIQKVADYMHALSPAAKALIAGLTAAAVGFTVVTIAIWAANAAIAWMTGGLSAVLGAVAGMAAGMLFAMAGTEELKTALDAVMGPLSQVLDAFGQLASVLAIALAPIAETLLGLLAGALRQVASALQDAMPTLMRFAAWVRAIAEFFAAVVGINLEAANAPARAPNAIRQAQSGSIQDFISRQYVSALQGASPQQKQLNVMEGLAGDVKEIRALIEREIGKPGQIKAALEQGVVGAGLLAVDVANWINGQMARVAGK